MGKVTSSQPRVTVSDVGIRLKFAGEAIMKLSVEAPGGSRAGRLLNEANAAIRWADELRALAANELRQYE